MNFRKTTQDLMPARREQSTPGQYEIYPGYPLPGGKIYTGYEALAERIVSYPRVLLDGYAGVMWDQIRAGLDKELRRREMHAAWVSVENALKSQAEINRLVAPFLGGDDPLFGTRFTGTLADFFDHSRLLGLTPDPDADLTIFYGPGAALSGRDGLLVYVDLPKNELQFRARAGLPTNLGVREALPPKQAYKRSYFVDWPALNAHKQRILSRVDWIIDAQRPDQPAMLSGENLRDALDQVSHTAFRVRPWFEPGPWGGQWIMQHIPSLPKTSNYAWSFELIVPENGLVFESSGNLLEVSFDWLMYCDHSAVLGKAADRFGTDFPIRFDFLDTLEGGNLSVQCHPRPEYTLREFGENFTQDETYYILDSAPGAKVYLGFQEGVNPQEFRQALERSFAENQPLDVDRYLQSHPSHKHDLFLIPNGTIHGSGQGNLVLEISSTPYIFTFKMYDWLRPDLDGKPRPLNIARAFENLYFERQGERVKEELISHPSLIAEGKGWKVIHLPTHPSHFYDVHSLEFEREITVNTEDRCHVLSLVEGSSILLETENGPRLRFNYAETFVVPAAAGQYRLINKGEGWAKVVKAFVK